MIKQIDYKMYLPECKINTLLKLNNNCPHYNELDYTVGDLLLEYQHMYINYLNHSSDKLVNPYMFFKLENHISKL